MKREHVDLDAGRILVFRHKTTTGCAIPFYPQARQLVEKLCRGKKAGDFLFPIVQSRKALTNACKRLGFPTSHNKACRDFFITRALEKNIDVQTIARWQGHRDGGKLILDTYGHVTSAHTDRMASMMTEETPANVVPIMQADAS